MLYLPDGGMSRSKPRSHCVGVDDSRDGGMVDTKVSKTFDRNRSCGFDSLSRHNIYAVVSKTTDYNDHAPQARLPLPAPMGTWKFKETTT